MDQIADFGAYLLGKVLFPRLLTMVVLEFVSSVDDCWVVELEIVNIYMLRVFSATIGREHKEALVVKFDVVLEAVYKLLRLMIPIRNFDYRVFILNSNFSYSIVVSIVEFVAHLVADSVFTLLHS